MHGNEHVPWASEFEDLRDEGTAAYYGPLCRLSSPQPVALCRDDTDPVCEPLYHQKRQQETLIISRIMR